MALTYTSGGWTINVVADGASSVIAVNLAKTPFNITVPSDNVPTVTGSGATTFYGMADGLQVNYAYNYTSVWNATTGNLAFTFTPGANPGGNASPAIVPAGFTGGQVSFYFTFTSL